MGALSPALRQKGAKELFYQRVQAAYRSLLAQVRQAVAPAQRLQPLLAWARLDQS